MSIIIITIVISCIEFSPEGVRGMAWTVKWEMFPFGTAGSLHLTSTISGLTSLAETLRGGVGAMKINAQ